jgi:hypothetical protein
MPESANEPTHKAFDVHSIHYFVLYTWQKMSIRERQTYLFDAQNIPNWHIWRILVVLVSVFGFASLAIYRIFVAPEEVWTSLLNLLLLVIYAEIINLAAFCLVLGIGLGHFIAKFFRFTLPQYYLSIILGNSLLVIFMNAVFASNPKNLVLPIWYLWCLPFPFIIIINLCAEYFKNKLAINSDDILDN